MSDRIFMLFVWAVGVMFFLAAIPFLPRQEVRTPLRAVGSAIVFGAMWPLLLMIALVRYAPWWYWLKWVEYREFLVTTKAADLQAEFKRNWDTNSAEEFPEAYRRGKERLESELSRLDTKANKLFSRKSFLENKLR